MNTREYWESRHRESDPLTAGGDRGLDSADNEAFYRIRIGRILEFIHELHGGRRPLEILDAGCGRGIVSKTLGACGHFITGIDVSETAVAYCRETCAGEFLVGTLEQLRADTRFDVVICLDVLFHILDDRDWQAALERLVEHSKSTGAVLLTDKLAERRMALGSYIVHRPQSDYERVLGPLGFRIAKVVPYAFGSNPNAFAVVVPITGGV